MKIDIKEKIRLNLPETNSSSSHSLVIGYDNHLKSKEDVLRELESYIDDSGILNVGSAEFGWEDGKYNSVYEKLQYLVAISCSYHGVGFDEEDFSDKVKVHKLLGKVERIVKNYTGLREVKFDIEGSNVDHQSVHLYSDILESNITIKKFLFSDQSWIFLGNDNGGPELGGLEMSNEDFDYGLLRVHIPGDIGNIDFSFKEPLTNFYDYDSDDIFRHTIDAMKILQTIVLKENSDGTISSYCNPYLGDQVDFVTKSIPNTALVNQDERVFSRKFVMKDGRLYVLWAAASVMIGYDNLCTVGGGWVASSMEKNRDIREHYFDYDNLPKDKIILIEAELLLDEFKGINVL